MGIGWEAGSERGLRGLKSAETRSHSGIVSQMGSPDTGSSPPQEKLQKGSALISKPTVCCQL